MRRSKTFAVALLASGAAVLPLGATMAGAAPAQDSLTSSACGTLGLLSQPVCEVVEQVEAALDPADPIVEPVTEAVQPVVDAVEPVTEALAPVIEALAPVTDAIAPVAPAAPSAPAPAPAPAPSPAPAERGAAPAPAPSKGSSAKATSFGAPTGFSAPLSSGVSGLGRHGATPAAPSGFSLQISPLGVPTLSIGSDFAAPALDADLPLPEAGPFEPVIEAVRAGASSSSDESKATVAIFALAALGLAAGMLIDQVRKAKAPFTIG
jgi:hypothetical protein